MEAPTDSSGFIPGVFNYLRRYRIPWKTMPRAVPRSPTSASAGAGDLVQAFERILDLLIRIDSGEDFIFFADEAGSWQVGVDEAVVLPAYFACLAASEDAEAFAIKVSTLIQALAEHKAEKFRRAARKVATPAQRRALTVAWRAKPRSWEAGRLFRQACDLAGE